MAFDDDTPVLAATSLVKSYGGRRVVDELSLSCQAGTVLGLLGPNGAGKTTTLRMLYGFIEPESGSIEYGGQAFREHRKEQKRLIGVCTQDDTLDTDFTVRQNMSVYAGYFRPAVPDLHARVDELLDRFELRPYEHMSPDKLSGGYRKRLLIARSIVHQPRILFLDEPTTGLDPKARLDVWELIDRMRSEGLAIILTTHYMDEAERLSDRLVVLSEGRAVAEGTTRKVLGDVLGEHILVVGASEPERDAIAQWARGELGARPQTVLGELHVPLSAADLARLTDAFEGTRLVVRAPNLDDLFLRLAVPRAGAS